MAGFEVNNDPGVFDFEDGYTLPNPAVRFQSQATVGMWFRDLVGEDVEVVDGLVLYPRVEKSKRLDIPLMVSQGADSSGNAASNRVQQLKENIAELSAIQDLTESRGAQDVGYTPWTGATPLDLSAVVTVTFGRELRGVGVTAVLTMIIDGGAPESDGS